MEINRTDASTGFEYKSPELPDTGAAQRDEFFQLLTAQMQNQDPLNPQEGADFVAQLAQFTNIELGMETNERLAGLQAVGQASSRAGMMDLVGKSIDADFSSFRLTDDAQPLDLTLDLDRPADTVTVTISDETGKVATIELENRGEGESTFSWDGTGTDGQPLPPGDYTVEVRGSDSEGDIDARATVSGIASSVEFTQDGATMFGFGPLLLDPASILSLTAVSDA